MRALRDAARKRRFLPMNLLALRCGCAVPPPCRPMRRRPGSISRSGSMTGAGRPSIARSSPTDGCHATSDRWLLDKVAGASTSSSLDRFTSLLRTSLIARPAIGWLQVTGSELRMAGARFKSAVVLVPPNAARKRAMTVRFRMIASPHREHVAAYWRSSSARRP